VGVNGYNPIAGPGTDGRTNFGTVTQPFRIARSELTSDLVVEYFNALGQMPQNHPAFLRAQSHFGSGAQVNWLGLQDWSFPGPGFRWYLPRPATDRRIPVLGLT
jgi:hypothetical protein